MAFFLHPADVAFGIAALFLFGIFVAGMGLQFLVFFAAALCGLLMFVLARRGLWREGAVFFCAVLAGTFYYHFYFRAGAARVNLPFNKQSTLTVFVSDEPQPTQNYLIITADAKPPFVGSLTILAPPASDYQYGDVLQVMSTVNPPDAVGGNAFMYLPKQIITLQRGAGFWLRAWMLDVKHAILAEYRAALPEDEAALLGGIAFGSKQNFKQELKDAMSLSGTTHLVAVSGYNITIVIVAVGALFRRYFSRRVTFAAAVIGLVLFMFMVGAQASAVRAAIMGFLALVAREMGECFSMRNAIAFTALFMTILDPAALTGNLSFILSFLSLLGIVYLSPPLKQLLRYGAANGNGGGGVGAQDGGLFDWKENAVTTLSAQLMVMPVLINSFGRFSLTAIGANILILSTVPLTMFFGVVLAALGFVSQYLAWFAAKLVGLMLAYQLFVMRLFAVLAVPLPLPLNSTFAIVLYYVLTAIFIFSYGQTHQKIY